MGLRSFGLLRSRDLVIPLPRLVGVTKRLSRGFRGFKGFKGLGFRGLGVYGFRV